MSESLIALGCDSSKGRMDVVVRNQHGTVLASEAFDDTPSGHARLRRLIDGLHERFPEATLLVGIEATGGQERNWLALLRREQRWGRWLRVHRLSGLAVKQFRASQLHRAPGDVAAASAIAEFLLERCAKRPVQEEPASGPLVFYRTIRALVEEQAACQQRILALLGSTHPDLVRFCRQGIPQWVRRVIERYPTAAQLAKAKVATLERMPHIDRERAQNLIAQARISVASLTDAGAALTMTLLIEELRHKHEAIDAAQEQLVDLIRAEPTSPLARSLDLLDGIPGIGLWGAACLACEIGDPARFAHEKALIAWAGLDPVVDTSGDTVIQRGISHRGNARVRAILFPIAMAAINHNPAVKATYQRLVQRGKCRLAAMTACMAKILRIGFAILVSGKPYRPTYDAERQATAAAQQAARSTPAQTPTPTPNTPIHDPHAPISRREARRRQQHATATEGGKTGSTSQPPNPARSQPQPPHTTIPAKG